ncbi:MAG: 4Fe-4S dicluster domain-containing protein [Chloroflexota bacterium]
MTEEIYQALAQALDTLPNGFPRTTAGTELEILRRIFSPAEATLACHLGRRPELQEALASRLGLPAAEVAPRLRAMAKRGLVWPEFDRASGERRYRLAPFIVGIYEAQLELMDHDLSHLVERYLADGGAAGVMGPLPALQRVVPARGAAEWVLPYDDVVAIVSRGEHFEIRDCICRTQQEKLGSRVCAHPLRTCLTLSQTKRPARPSEVDRAAALALIEEAEQLGLVHTVSNMAAGLFYVCNCCGCCCGLLRGINEWGQAGAVARASYVATVEAEACSGCGVCLERCQVGALTLRDGVAEVDDDRCLGCGLCVTGCPSRAVRLEPLPEAEAIHPPEDFAAWEEARLRFRSLLDHEH